MSAKDDVKPINLKLEKDISTEFNKISTILENQNSDWKLRMDALKTLQGMVIGSTSNHELFMPFFQRMSPHINFQLKDLRSAVQKEACRLLTFAAERFQRGFETTANRFVSRESLLSIINSGNKLLSENAHSCVLSLIEFCPSGLFLPAFLEESLSKSQQVRSKVSLYLAYILDDLPSQSIEKNLSQLDSVILKCVQDANPEVRQNFRSVFAIYNRLYPQKANKILAAVDLSIKKLLQDEIRATPSSLRNPPASNQDSSTSAGSTQEIKSNKTNNSTKPLSSSASQQQEDQFIFATSQQLSQQQQQQNNQQQQQQQQQQQPYSSLNQTTPKLLQSSVAMSKVKHGSTHASTINNDDYPQQQQQTHYGKAQTKYSQGDSPQQIEQSQQLAKSVQSKSQSTRFQTSPVRSAGVQQLSQPLSNSNMNMSTKNINNNNNNNTRSNNHSNNGNDSSEGNGYMQQRGLNAYKSSDQFDSKQKMGSQHVAGGVTQMNKSNSNMGNRSAIVVSRTEEFIAGNKSNNTNGSGTNNNLKHLQMEAQPRKNSLHRSQQQQQQQQQQQNRVVDHNLDEDQYELYHQRNSQEGDEEVEDQEEFEYISSQGRTAAQHSLRNGKPQDNSDDYGDNYNNNNEYQGHEEGDQEEERNGDRENEENDDDDQQRWENGHQGHDPNQDDDDDDFDQQLQQQGYYGQVRDHRMNRSQDASKKQEIMNNKNASNRMGNARTGTNSSSNSSSNNRNNNNNNKWVGGIDENDNQEENNAGVNWRNNKPQQSQQLSQQQQQQQQTRGISGVNSGQHHPMQVVSPTRMNQKKDNSLPIAGATTTAANRMSVTGGKAMQNNFMNASSNLGGADRKSVSPNVVKSSVASVTTTTTTNAVTPSSTIGFSKLPYFSQNNQSHLSKARSVIQNNRMQFNEEIHSDLSGSYASSSNQSKVKVPAAVKNVQSQEFAQSSSVASRGSYSSQAASNTAAAAASSSTNSNNNHNTIEQQQQYQLGGKQNGNVVEAWREDDVELLLEKITTNKNWSTRASAFDSLKEIITELGNANGNSNNSGANEKLSVGLMKRIVSAHIECLSDSHFKVISACLDSLIAIMSFDSACILPKLDLLTFKVLNNLIDTKDVVSSRANFLVNLISKVFPPEKLIEPIQKVLEQTNKSLLKVCSLEVLMVTVKGAEEYYGLISNVRHTVQLMCLQISENPTQKQITLPCLGILLALRDHNWQGTLHSILSLSNQAQISALRNLSYEFAPDLDEDLRKYAQKESQKPNEKIDKLAKVNGKQFLFEQSSSSSTAGNYNSISGTGTQQNNSESIISASLANVAHMKTSQIPSQTFSKGSNKQMAAAAATTGAEQRNGNSYNSSQISTNKTSNQSPAKTPPIQFDLQSLEDISNCVSDFDGNEPLIVQQINTILLNTVGFFKQSPRKFKEHALRILSILFHRNYFYLTIQPNTVFECLNIYPYIPKDMDFYAVDELIDEMIDCVPHLTFMKALVEKLNTEKPPHLQIMIKKISFILRKARKEEIRPFLDHIIDSFKLQINDQSPDVRKSVVFCLVDLKYLMRDEIDPYLHQFSGNQQKLVEIYIEKRMKSGNNNNASTTFGNSDD